MINEFMEVVPLKNEDISEFKHEIQKAFQLGYEAEFGTCQETILPEKDIDESLNGENAFAWKAVRNGELIGGAVVRIDAATQNELELFFVKCGCQSHGVGQKIWHAMETQYSETKIWKTCTPYFEKRNIHFYVNRCGFHIVEFFNPKHKAAWDHGEAPEPVGGMCAEAGAYFFAFEKHMKSVLSGNFYRTVL